MALRLSPKWIQSFCKFDGSIEAMANALSQSGFETEVVEDLIIDDKIVVGEVVSVEKHPNAEKLNVCKVSTGSELLTIVCGCPTVTTARYVLVAPIGTKLPGITLSQVTLRGVVSEGMICSLSEIGLVEESQGIYHLHETVAVGTKLVDWLKHDHQLLEIDITPNRGDCLSVYGMARDLAASQNIGLQDYEQEILASVDDKVLFSTELEDVSAYAALALTVNPEKKTPLFILNRLRQAGIGPNHVVVDILNYVMLETGQPMHGFDQDALSLPLEIKEGKTASLTLLNGDEYAINPWDIVVYDQKGPQALAGIMGGFTSRVQSTTVRIQLESAIFKPERIAKSLRRCSLRSDASYRYERGVSPDLNEKALAYAAGLLEEYAGAMFLGKQYYQQRPVEKKIKLTKEFTNQYLGIDIDSMTIIDLLGRLGMTVSTQEKVLTVTVPHHRYDVTIKEDLVEEIARLYGYNNIPLKEMTGVLNPRLPEKDQIYDAKIAMVHMGYHEVVQFSFVPESLLSIFPAGPAIEIDNPINERYSFMRTHLWQSLILAAQYNYQRQQNNLKIFELGTVFCQEDKICESQQIAYLAMGDIKTGYSSKKETVDYFYMQSVVLKLIQHYTIESIDFQRTEHPALHPNQSADIFIDGQLVGSVGMLHPKTAIALNLPEIGLCYIDIDNFPVVAQSKIQRPSKYPAIYRDVTLSVNASVTVASLEAKVENIPNMVSMTLSDIYTQEKGVQKITWTIKFQSTQETLSDKKINAAMTIIQQQLDS